MDRSDGVAEHRDFEHHGRTVDGSGFRLDLCIEKRRPDEQGDLDRQPVGGDRHDYGRSGDGAGRGGAGQPDQVGARPGQQGRREPEQHEHGRACLGARRRAAFASGGDQLQPLRRQQRHLRHLRRERRHAARHQGRPVDRRRRRAMGVHRAGSLRQAQAPAQPDAHHLLDQSQGLFLRRPDRHLYQRRRRQRQAGERRQGLPVPGDAARRTHDVCVRRHQSNRAEADVEEGLHAAHRHRQLRYRLGAGRADLVAAPGGLPARVFVTGAHLRRGL